MQELDKLISPEREYLERVYIDYLRTQYPTLQEFRKFAADSFEVNKLRGYRRKILSDLTYQISGRRLDKALAKGYSNMPDK
jgi:hypothetical protein